MQCVLGFKGTLSEQKWQIQVNDYKMIMLRN